MPISAGAAGCPMKLRKKQSSTPEKNLTLSIRLSTVDFSQWVWKKVLSDLIIFNCIGKKLFNFYVLPGMSFSSWASFLVYSSALLTPAIVAKQSEKFCYWNKKYFIYI